MSSFRVDFTTWPLCLNGSLWHLLFSLLLFLSRINATFTLGLITPRTMQNEIGHMICMNDVWTTIIKLLNSKIDSFKTKNAMRRRLDRRKFLMRALLSFKPNEHSIAFVEDAIYGVDIITIFLSLIKRFWFDRTKLNVVYMSANKQNSDCTPVVEAWSCTGLVELRHRHAAWWNARQKKLRWRFNLIEDEVQHRTKETVV